MPEDIGQPVDVERVQNYIAFRGRMRYDFAKTEGESVSENSFSFHDATLFYSGPFGKNFGAFFEIEREASDDIGLTAQVIGAWGTEQSFGGFRAGEMHWILSEGLAGFDRPTGINRPTPVSDKVTDGVPFRFRKNQVGVEGYYVTGKNRISVQVLNGIDVNGSGGGSDPDTKKDFVVADQVLLDEAGSGITAVAYYGSLEGLEPLSPNETSHYWRLALSANKYIDNLEVSGTVVYGKDTDLPVVTNGRFGSSTAKGVGYWVYGGYTFRPTGDEADAGTPLTLFSRYEYTDQNTSIDNNANRRWVGGFVLPVNLPEYLRLALEYSLDLPQGNAPNTHGLVAEMMLNF